MIHSYTDIPGWYDYESLFEEIVRRYNGGVLVEIGVYLGRSICHLGQLVKTSGKPFTVVGVDTCRGSGVESVGHNFHDTEVRNGGGTFAGTLHRNILDLGLGDVVNIIVADSVVAAGFFADNTITFANIDARHDYDSVKKDIAAWLPKVKIGGVLSGDDIGVPHESNPIWPDIKRAVNDSLVGWKYHRHDSWWYEKK